MCVCLLCIVFRLFWFRVFHPLNSLRSAEHAMRHYHPGSSCVFMLRSHILQCNLRTLHVLTFNWFSMTSEASRAQRLCFKLPSTHPLCIETCALFFCSFRRCAHCGIALIHFPRHETPYTRSTSLFSRFCNRYIFRGGWDTPYTIIRQNI